MPACVLAAISARPPQGTPSHQAQCVGQII